jgi:hypothetical protein
MIWYQVWKDGKQIGCHCTLSGARRSARIIGGMVAHVEEPVYCQIHGGIHSGKNNPLVPKFVPPTTGEEETLP